MATVRLKHITPLWVCSDAIRQCHATQAGTDYGGPVDCALIDRVGNKMKHASTLEHIIVQLDISDISRALLQEWSRHRIGMSQTVKSSRYTLKELKEEEPFTFYDVCRDNCTFEYLPTPDAFVRASKYVVYTGNDMVDEAILFNLEELRELIAAGVSNDVAKYAMPDAYKTSLTCSINFRSLQNLLYLRSAPSALWEFRELAQAIFEAIPEEYQFLLKDSLYEMAS